MEFAGSARPLSERVGRDARPAWPGVGGWLAWADASALLCSRTTAEDGARRPYLGRLGLIRLIARKHSAGTHLSAMTQKSLQGGRRVYSTRISKL